MTSPLHAAGYIPPVTDLQLSPASPALDLRDPALYINRELSWLEFHRRVLHEAVDPRTPLLERLKFLGICGGNLDEFFQVRVAGLKRQVSAGIVERTADGMTPEAQLRAISQTVRELVWQDRRCLHDELLPQLADHGVVLHPRLRDVPPDERARLDAYFHSNVFPVLTPLAVDPGHPFPYISNLSLSLAVVLRGADGEERFARVKVPKILPRWVPLLLPNQFVPLEEVIGANLEALFPGVEILGWYTFRITRNTELQIEDNDEADDLLSPHPGGGPEPALRGGGPHRGACLDALIAQGTAAGRVQRAAGAARAAAHRGGPLRGPRPPRHRGPAHARQPGDLRASGPAVPPGDPGSARGSAEHLRRDPRGRHPPAPPVRQLRDLGRALHPDRGGRSGRPRDQADALPYRWRLQHRSHAGARRGAREAGRGPDRAAGPVRRGEQHHLGPAPGGRRRARELRGRRAQDPRQGGPGGAPRGRHHAPLRAHRHRQLQPQDRTGLLGFRPAQRPRRPRRRPDRPLQRAHRLRLACGVPTAHRGAARDAGADSSR